MTSGPLSQAAFTGILLRQTRRSNLTTITEAPDPDCDARRVRRQLRRFLEGGARLVTAGTGKSDPEGLVQRYAPRCAVDLFDATYFLSRYLYDEALGFFVGFLVLGGPDGHRVRKIYPRLFYKDSSLMWRVASHYVHDEEEYWIGKGDVQLHEEGGDTHVCSVEETTNLPLEIQAAFDTCSRAAPRRQDDDAVDLVLRRAPSGRIEPYGDFTAPRRKNRIRINRGRPVARFLRPGDPSSLRFAKGFEPDLKSGLVGRTVTHSAFFGGQLEKFRVLSANRKIQYMFFASPTHAWLNPPQALTEELSTYGVRVVDVHAPDDLFVPGYEYHEATENGDVTHSQIPKGYVGAPHPDDPHRSDASRWLEALPVIRDFRKRFL